MGYAELLFPIREAARKVSRMGKRKRLRYAYQHVVYVSVTPCGRADSASKPDLILADGTMDSTGTSIPACARLGRLLRYKHCKVSW